MSAPIVYVPDFMPDIPVWILDRDIPWEKREDAPRGESWMSLRGEDYTYGRGAGQRTYKSNAVPGFIGVIMARLALNFGANFDACFANRYEDHK